MTRRKQAIQRKADWSLALAEGRVVRMDDGLTMKSFPTVAEAERVLQILINGGTKAEIIKVLQPNR